jgi:hypothetical protein
VKDWLAFPLPNKSFFNINIITSVTSARLLNGFRQLNRKVIIKMIKIDWQYLSISMIVSIIVSVMVAFMIRKVQPDLNISAGTWVFIFIGVFAANLIIEAGRQRLNKDGKDNGKTP